MRYSVFPGTEIKVSSLGLGTWVLGGENWGGNKEEESLSAVIRSIDMGMTFIDTAPFYGYGLSEKLIGKAIEGRRDKVFIATKCGLVRRLGMVKKDLSPASIMEEVDYSRKRLNVDTIDLYQCHWPDDQTPIEKTMEAMLNLQMKGVIKYIGVSNFDLPLLKRAAAAAPVKTLQVQYSLLERSAEQDLLPYCLQNNIGLIAYGAIGGGILSGKYVQRPQFGKWDARSMFYKFFNDKKFDETIKLIDELRTLGYPLNQIALNWVRQKKGVMTVLCGCRNAVQVQQNAPAANWDLTDQEMEQIRLLLDRR